MIHLTPVSKRNSTGLVALWSILLMVGVLVSAGNAASIPADLREIHVLNRLGFGPRPGDIEQVRSMGVDKFIDEQLSPRSISLPQSLVKRIDSMETLRRNAAELFLEYGPPSYGSKPGDPQAAQRGRQRARVILDQAFEARLLRAVESPRQLEEVMVNFWFNHFNVFSQKGLDHLWIGSYEEEAIRPNVMGRFRDLLGATAKHPAMLFYLDNWQNTAPNSPGARGRFKGLNENYARELMELHTLGVDGGYTQTDVITLARILTGWGFRRPGQALQQGLARKVATGGVGNQSSSNGFFFDANRHDFSTKVFLGHTIRASGLGEGEEALDILAQHPSTARHISYELAGYFVADDPPKSLVDRLAGRFSDTRGDIRAVLDTLFHSPEFWDEQYVGKKFKTPYEYVISAVRATGDPVVNTRPLRGVIAQLGMPPYGCQTPDGYKNVRDAWLNPNAMTQRLNFATALGAGRLRLAEEQPNAMDQMVGTPEKRMENQAAAVKPVDSTILATTVGNKISEQTRATVEDSPPALRAALILGSPDFMYR
jgi:uncharacterized protein (DUF1800 family)